MTSPTPGFPLAGPAVPDPAPGVAQVDPHAPERHGPPSFHGIRELDGNPPRIWTYVYLLCFGAAVWLFVAYPAIPWFSGATGGVFGWSSRADLSRAVDRAEAALPGVAQRFAAASIEEIEADPALREYGIAGGHAADGRPKAGLQLMQLQIGTGCLQPGYGGHNGSSHR